MWNNVAFIDTSGLTPKVTSRKMIPSDIYRASKYVQHNGREYVYVVAGNHYLDVYDITDISSPPPLSIEIKSWSLARMSPTEWM